MLTEHDISPSDQADDTISQPDASNPEAPSEAPRPPIHPDALLRAGIGLGAVMVGAAIIWINLIRGENIWQTLQPGDSWQLVPGFLIGTIFALAIWRAGQRLKDTRQIIALLEKTLDLSAIEFRHVLLFSLLAAFPEEMLFRGALQPEVGLILASVIFGALHALTRLYFLYATMAGLLLGVLFALSGSLWLPIGTHFAVDLVMFLLLLQRNAHASE